MSYATARATIETRFQEQWVVGSPPQQRTKIGWDGQSFEPPTDEPSVRLTIVHGDSFNQSMGSPGSNVVRRVGVVFIEIYTPGGQGSVAARELVDAARPIFENWRSGNLLFRTMNVSPPDDRPPFYKLTVSFPFQLDTQNG